MGQTPAPEKVAEVSEPSVDAVAPNDEDIDDNAPKNKQYRRMVDVEFCDKLLVSAMINVKAYGRVDMPFVLWLLVWEWHAQLKDETKHPRKRGFELFNTKQTNCCFKSNQEWSDFDVASRGRGKGTAADDEAAPTMPIQYQTWASLKFDKWLDIVREMQNIIHPAFVRAMLQQHSSLLVYESSILTTFLQAKMFNGKRMPSGRCSDSIINQFKQTLFNTWCTEPTTKGSTAKYKVYPMPPNYIPFSTWDLWVAIGPINGEACNPILKIEFLAPAARLASVPANGANPNEMPLALTALVDTQAGKFVSRSAQLKASQDPKTKASFVSPISDTKQQYHSRRHKMSVVNDQIKHLEFIWRSDLSTPAQKSSAHVALHQLRLNAISSFDISVFEVCGRATFQGDMPLLFSPQDRDNQSDSSATPVIATTPTAFCTSRNALMSVVKAAQQNLDEKFSGRLADTDASAAATRASFSEQQGMASPQSLTRAVECGACITNPTTIFEERIVAPLPHVVDIPTLQQRMASPQSLTRAVECGACITNPTTIFEERIVAPLPHVVDIPTFSSSMGYGLYLRWLKGVHGLKEICVPSDGMCLFDCTLRGIQELKAFSGENSYKPLLILDIVVPNGFTVSIQRTHFDIDKVHVISQF